MMVNMKVFVLPGEGGTDDPGRSWWFLGSAARGQTKVCNPQARRGEKAAAGRNQEGKEERKPSSWQPRKCEIKQT